MNKLHLGIILLIFLGMGQIPSLRFLTDTQTPVKTLKTDQTTRHLPDTNPATILTSIPEQKTASPGAKKIDLRMNSAEILARLSSRSEEDSLTADGQISNQILQAGEDLAEFSDALEHSLQNDSSLDRKQALRVALSFYRSCAEMSHLAESVRASCYLDLKTWAKQIGSDEAFTGLALPAGVLRIAQSMGQEGEASSL